MREIWKSAADSPPQKGMITSKRCMSIDMLLVIDQAVAQAVRSGCGFQVTLGFTRVAGGDCCYL